MLIRRKRDGNLYHIDEKTTYIDPNMPTKGPCFCLVPHWHGCIGGRRHYKTVERTKAEYTQEDGQPI